MRASEFTFKKTKRIKVVVQHRAISIDLTEKEAADLLAYLVPACTPDGRYQDLTDALRCFCEKSGTVSDLRSASSFRMVKAK